MGWSSQAQTQGSQEAQSDYSGKKKRHTLKQLVISTPSGIIIDQSPAVGGRRHDFKVFKDDMAARCAMSSKTIE
jgi:hypothetical protein